MNLWEYLDMRISVTDIVGNVYEGIAYMYIPANENEEDWGKAAASIIIDGGDPNILWEIYEDEIAHIEILSSVEARSGV